MARFKAYSFWAFFALCAWGKPAAATTCSVPYTFSNNTTADANQVNSNFSSLKSCANSVDYLNIGTSGIKASQIKPTNPADATFGGSSGYTFYPGTSGSVPLILDGATGQSADLFDIYGTPGGTQLFGVNPSGVATVSSYYNVGVPSTPSSLFLNWGVNNGGNTTAGLFANNNASALYGVYPNLFGIEGSFTGYTLTQDSAGNTAVLGNFNANGGTFHSQLNTQGILDGANIATSGSVTAGYGTGSGSLLAGSGTLNYNVSTSNQWNFSQPLSVAGAITSNQGTNQGSLLLGSSTGNKLDFGTSTSGQWTFSSGQVNVNGVLSATGNVLGATGNFTGPVFSRSTGSSVSGAVAPGYSSGGATLASSFHSVFLAGTTASGVSTCGDIGSTYCYSVTVLTAVKFTSRSTYACSPVNQLDGSGYTSVKTNGVAPQSNDGQTFYLNSDNPSTPVSAICSGT